MKEQVKMVKLGRYQYPITAFLDSKGKPFENVSKRLYRDRRIRPRIAKELQNRYRCPDCGSWLNDEFEGHYACENCPYVAWDKPIPIEKQVIKKT